MSQTMTIERPKTGCVVTREGKMGQEGKMSQPRKFTGLTESHQVPLIEYVYFEHSADHIWRVWLNYNRDRTCGTYLVLCSDGEIKRETRTPTGEVVTAGTVKPALDK